MKAISTETWALARQRQSQLLARAEREYPYMAGYIHTPASDGWPDPHVVVRVYKRVPDRRCALGHRLDYVATLGPITDTDERGD